MTTPPRPPARRSLDERRRAAVDLLENNTQLWLATGSDGHGAHLIPVAYVWDGQHLTMSTFERSRTTANVRANPTARTAIGHPQDLAMVDGEVSAVAPGDMDLGTADAYARVSFDPRGMPGLVYLRLVPSKIQVWTGFHEFHGRTVMADGRWLDEPVGESTGALPEWMAPPP